MNKSQLVDDLSTKTQITKVKAAEVVDAFIEVVVDTLKKEEKVSLIGFGTFSTIKRKAREGRNPKTGKAIKIAASVSPKFKPGKAFKEVFAVKNK